MSQKRPKWDEYFLGIAKAVSARGTCLRARYGAIIVKDNVIVSTGYVGSPRGEPNCIDIGECERQRLQIASGERYELCKSVHAEQNAIINGDPEKMKGATMYIWGTSLGGHKTIMKPCGLCKRMIINAQIGRVVT